MKKRTARSEDRIHKRLKIDHMREIENEQDSENKNDEFDRPEKKPIDRLYFDIFILISDSQFHRRSFPDISIGFCCHSFVCLVPASVRLSVWCLHRFVCLSAACIGSFVCLLPASVRFSDPVFPDQSLMPDIHDGGLEQNGRCQQNDARVYIFGKQEQERIEDEEQAVSDPQITVIFVPGSNVCQFVGTGGIFAGIKCGRCFFVILEKTDQYERRTAYDECDETHHDSKFHIKHPEDVKSIRTVQNKKVSLSYPVCIRFLFGPCLFFIQPVSGFYSVRVCFLFSLYPFFIQPVSGFSARIRFLSGPQQIFIHFQPVFQGFFG